MEIDHPPQEGGESVQKHASSVWETRPTLIPITVTLRDGLPKRDVQVCYHHTTVELTETIEGRLGWSSTLLLTLSQSSML